MTGLPKLQSQLEVAKQDYPFVVHKKHKLFKQLLDKKEEVAVIGLGYVGLPLAMNVATKFKVVGYDVNIDKIESLQNKKDPCKEINFKDFEEADINFSGNIEDIKHAKFFVVSVPTPIDAHKEPDLTYIKSATAELAKILKEGDCVVYESTVYPGCTEEVCVPILEELSGLRFNTDFVVGYSPERINPGDLNNTFTSIKKIVSASTPEALELVANVYGSVVTAGVHKAPSIKVAESAKIIENVQRDVNISLMNELSQIFSRLKINTTEVLEAAGTKWNFHNYYPGLVGGHCIGVDPYYLINKAKKNHYNPKLLQAARNVNENMMGFIANQLENRLNLTKKSDVKRTVLVKGITFKENVNDIRNSKTAELCKILEEKGFEVVVQDYMANKKEVEQRYGLKMVSATTQRFDAIVLAVDHNEYKELSYKECLINGTKNTLIFDVKGNKKDRFPQNVYMSL